MGSHAQAVTMDVRIEPFDDGEHRDQVVGLWREEFGYADARNEPGLVIDRKLAAGDGLLFVALADDRVAGTVMAGYDGHRGWVYSLVVSPERRGRGIGTRLMERAERELEGLGCVKVNLQIFGHNEGARGFYLRRGYRVEERISMGKEIPGNIG
jgi:ribosomal protein S18 acetylase RimI-like enzyme